MKILVTNDDGIDSPGIWTLAEAVSHVGEVLIVAPDRQQSGVGTSISLHSGLDIDEISSTIKGVRAYAVGGTPTDCTILGIRRLAEGHVDLLVSGINTGANIGSGILGSGTVMPTRLAHSYKIPSFAVSLDMHSRHSQREPLFGFAGRMAQLLALSIRNDEMPPGVILNVNVPSIPAEQNRGVAVTRVATIPYRRARTEQRDDGLIYNRLFTVDDDDPDIEEGTDIWAINKGLVSITPLRFEITDHNLIPALVRHTRPLEVTLSSMAVEGTDQPE